MEWRMHVWKSYETGTVLVAHRYDIVSYGRIVVVNAALCLLSLCYTTSASYDSDTSSLLYDLTTPSHSINFPVWALSTLNNFIHHKSGSNKYKDKQTNITKLTLSSTYINRNIMVIAFIRMCLHTELLTELYEAKNLVFNLLNRTLSNSNLNIFWQYFAISIPVVTLLCLRCRRSYCHSCYYRCCINHFY